MSANPFDTRPDRTTTVERRGLIVLAIMVCASILAIAAWRSRPTPVAPAVPQPVEQAAAADSVAAATPSAATPSPRSKQRHKSPKKTHRATPAPPRESPLNRPL